MHCYLSPSAAHRWTECTASPSFCKNLPPAPTSVYAAEGTKAHEEAAKMLESKEVTNENEHLIGYYNYCNDTSYCISGVETRVKLDILHGFGTVDFFGVNKNLLRIVDLKYGKGVKVHAENNLQLLLYAYGLYSDMIKYVIPIKSVQMCIYQPRIDNISEWDITLDEMLKIIDSLKPKINAAYTGNKVVFKEGPWCFFCPGKKECSHMRNTQAIRDFKEE
jgi:hypothetical protein